MEKDDAMRLVEQLTITGRLDRLFIGGEWVLPAGKDRASVVDPSTEEPVAQIALGSAKDVGAAVEAARCAFATWSACAVAGRIRSGQVHINNPAWSPHAPFGGYKRSGNREYGVEGLQEYLETKAILGWQSVPG